MAQAEIPWYEVVEGTSELARKKLVTSEYFASAVSVEELADVEIQCIVPIMKMSYEIHNRAGEAVQKGEFTFPEEGVTRFALRDVLPLGQLKAFETETADYGIATTVTLASGDEIGSYFTFEGWLHTGTTTTQIPEKNLAQRLAAIPIAKPGMTEDQLRQICVDFIRLEVEAPFKLKEDFTYRIESQRRDRTLLGGKVYGGLPYVSRGAGNLYRLAEICDPVTGELDQSSDVFHNIRYFGNACSGAASMAWARVITSAYLGYTMFMTEANGFLPVGPYRYSKENVAQFIRKDPAGYNCRTICQENGEQTMFESYAQMKPADGVVSNGHVRMNSAVPTVVRNPDGTIDGDRSYTLMHEQVCYSNHPNHIRIASDGSHYVAQGCADIKYTFRKLFDAAYIPFTFAEFKDPSRVEPTKVRLAVEPQLKDRVLTCNYPISDVFIEVGGKRYAYRNMEFFRKEVKMSDMFPEELLTKDARLFCQLYNGEYLEVFHTAK